MGGAIRSVFLSAFDLPKAVYISTAGATAFLIDSVRIITYVARDISLEKPLWWGMALFIPASFLGAFIARRIAHHIPEKKFRLVIAVFLFLAALNLLIGVR